MKETLNESDRRKSVRERSKASGKEKYPAGRALGRIEYFETKRSLTKTVFSNGVVKRIDEDEPELVKSGVKDPKVKVGRYLAALNERLKITPEFTETDNMAVWRPLGPSLIPRGQTYGTGGNNRPSVSGRCIGIYVSPIFPGYLVVCSANGGLWGSVDDGRSWQPLTDEYPTLSMGAISVAPGASNIVYAGLGEGDTFSQLGVGLLRSNDGAKTWNFIPSNELSGLGIYDIAVSPSDPFHLWVGTTSRLFESRDGGESWRIVQKLRTWSISIHGNNNDEIYAATNAGLIRSKNGGTTWMLVSLPNLPTKFNIERMEVMHAPSNPEVVYVTASTIDNLTGVQEGNFWRKATTNGGFSSETTAPLKDSDLNQSWYDWCFGIAPDDENEVYWGAVELYKGKRNTSGFVWENVSSRSVGDSIHPDHHHISFDPIDHNIVYVCNDGGLYRSKNRGENWESLNPGLNITEFEYITHLESDDDWLMGGTQDNGTVAYKQGKEWRQVALGDGGDCGTDDINGLCYHSYYGMWVERAKTKGRSAFRWKDVSPRFNHETYQALFYPPMEVNINVIAKAGESLFVSSDRGNRWTEISYGSTGVASALAIPSDDVIIIGTEKGEMFKVVRGNLGWDTASVYSLTSPGNVYISDLFLPSDENGDIWLSSSSFGAGHVFVSLDGGETWDDRTNNLPDIPVNALVGDPADHNHLFIATDHGVYETIDSGTIWNDFSLGLPNVLVGDLIFHKRLRLLRAGTRSRGIWEANI